VLTSVRPFSVASAAILLGVLLFVGGQPTTADADIECLTQLAPPSSTCQLSSPHGPDFNLLPREGGNKVWDSGLGICVTGSGSC
jgi:hypothetical protein